MALDATKATVSRAISWIVTLQTPVRLCCLVPLWVARLRLVIEPAGIAAAQTTVGMIFLSLNSDVYLRSDIRRLISSNIPPAEEAEKLLDEAIRAAEARLQSHRSATASALSVLLSPPVDIAALLSDLEQWKLIRSPIRRLPPEIIQHIFLLGFTYKSYHWRSFAVRDRLWPWTLSRVCRFWRSVSLSTPTLWAYIPSLSLSYALQASTNCPKIRDAEYQRTAFMLRHAQNTPLHIVMNHHTNVNPIDWPDDHDEGGNTIPWHVAGLHPALSLLTQHSERWETAQISLQGIELLEYLQCIKGRLSSLRSLDIELLRDVEVPGVLRAWDMFSICPNLQEVSLVAASHRDYFVLPPDSRLRCFSANIRSASSINQGYLDWSMQSLSTLRNLDLTYPDPMDQIVLQLPPSPLPPLFHLTRLHLNPPTLWIIDELTLPCLEDLRLVKPASWDGSFLTACLSLLRRSSVASPSSRIPMTNLYLHSTTHELNPRASQNLLSIFQLSGHFVRNLTIPLPTRDVLRSLAVFAGPDTVLPALEICVFIVTKKPKARDFYAINLFAITRCDHESLIHEHDIPPATVKPLKSLALRVANNSADLAGWRSKLEGSCIWTKGNWRIRCQHKHPAPCLPPPLTDGSDADCDPISPNFHASPSQAITPHVNLLKTLEDIVKLHLSEYDHPDLSRLAERVPVSVRPSDFIKSCDKIWYTEEKTQCLIVQLEGLADERFDVTTGNFPKLYCLLREVKERLDCTPSETVKSRYPYFFDLEKVVYRTLRKWYSLIQEELPNVHWVIYPSIKKLFFIPKHDPTRASEDAVVLLGADISLYGKRDVIMQRYNIS